MIAIPKIDRDLIATIGLFVAAAFGAALTLSSGTIEWGSVFPAYLALHACATFIAFVPKCYYRAYRIIRSRGEIASFFQDPTILAWPVVPVVIVPLFFTSFTVMKHLIADIGFTWDRAFTDIDRAIFGIDPWRLTHAVFGSSWATEFLAFCYTHWPHAVCFSMAIISLWANREYATRFLLWMLLTWTVAGVAFASMFASAGPCFVYLFDAELAARFEPLMTQLLQAVGDDNAIILSQAYLAERWNADVAAPGGAISAFPSVHVAVAVFYVLASWHNKILRIGAIAYALLIWIGSVHFGYHYSVDGVAGGVIAVGCWWCAGRIVSMIVARNQPAGAFAT